MTFCRQPVQNLHQRAAQDLHRVVRRVQAVSLARLTRRTPVVLPTVKKHLMQKELRKKRHS